MRTVVGIIIADHLPGVKTHRRNAHVLALSRVEPADLIIVIRLTRPVFKSISSRYKPSPRRSRDQVAGSLECSRKGYDGPHAQIMSRAHSAFAWRLP